MKISLKLKSFQKFVITLASLVTIFSLVAPSVADALLLDDLTGIIETSLSATNDITSPLLRVYPDVLKYYLVSLMCLMISTSILEWEINNPDWMNLKGSMVTKGWDLTRGLANMFLLLIFLAVAFGFILRIESLESAKALPRLIIVALLLNFSKLFVGMLVDIATIANNTIMYGHESFLRTVMTGFISSMYSVLATMILQIVKDFLLISVPLGGLVKLGGMIASLAWRGLFISSLPVWIFQIVVASALTLIFCVYIILFAARVYIIQILAILSPLAFLCLILPQTQKYWDEWLKHLIQWCFVGTILLFFLMLGLYAGNSILPNVDKLPDPFDPGQYIPLLNVPKYYLFYSFLFIYLAVSFWMVDRTMPMIAVAIMGMSKGLATKGWNKYGKDIKNDVVRRVNEKAAAHADRDKKVRDENGNLTLQGAEKWKHRVNSAALKPVFGAHRVFQSSPKASMRKYQNEDQENLEKHFGKDDDGVDRAMETMAADPSLYRRMDTSKKLALMNYGMKYKGSSFLKDMEKKGILHDSVGHAAIHNKSMVTKAAGYHPDLLDQSERGQKIRDIILSSESKAPDELARMSDIHMDATESEVKDKAAMSLASKKILGNKDNMDNWSKDALDNKKLQEAIVYNANSGDVQKIGEKQGQATLDSIHETFENQHDKIAYGNKKLVRATASNTGMGEVFKAVGKVTDKGGKEDQKKYIEEIIQTETDRRHNPGQTNLNNWEGNQRGRAGTTPPQPTDTTRRTRTQQPGQSDLGANFGRGRTAQSNLGTYAEPEAGGTPPAGPVTTPPTRGDANRQTRAPRPGQTTLGDNDDIPRANNSRSGRTTNDYPDDTNRP